MSMIPADQAKYKALYIETSRQYLEKINTALSILLEDKDTDESVHELFVAAHSLAGQSMVIGYNQIGEYAASIQKIIEKKTTLDKPLLEIIQGGIKKVEASLEEIEKHDRELDLSEEIHKLNATI